ncbi:MAG: dNTP triphosphohydrolase [Bacteroidetes bacterium]|nr:dNTP triphosphohydrolase [Bacteroidota bacterium]
MRSGFQQDFDRIVFSSIFRRLQNKTQVLPFPKSDYVRNRLTHSLEASSVGRSLGTIAGKDVIERYPSIENELGIKPQDFGNMVSSACLAHDIGNPPFGHSGEDAINLYFKSDRAQQFLEGLSTKQKADLQNFEGNSSGFRLIASTLDTQSSPSVGLHLTYGTYGTYCKYPKEVLPNREDERKASLTKYGLFQTEVKFFKKIAKELSLISQNTHNNDIAYKRFPLAFLVEAADDICYRIIDFEDGYNMGLISFKKITEHYISILKICQNSKFKKKLDQIIDKRSIITYLRSLIIYELIYRTSKIFLKNEDGILDGSYDKPLIKSLDPELVKILNEIKSISKKKIYKSQTVIKIEAAGFKVIPFLLHTFVKSRLAKRDYEGRNQILGLLPAQYHTGKNNYEKILNTVMFISSMTDRYAVDLYRNLKGIELADY